MTQEAQATSVALIYRFFLNLPRKYSGLFWKCLVCISWFKKEPKPRIETDFISQGMRFMLNDSSIQKKEVKLENKRNRYFLCFYRVDEHKLESTAND